MSIIIRDANTGRNRPMVGESVQGGAINVDVDIQRPFGQNSGGPLSGITLRALIENGSQPPERE